MKPSTRRSLRELKTVAIYTVAGYFVMLGLAVAVTLADWMVSRG